MVAEVFNISVATWATVCKFSGAKIQINVNEHERLCKITHRHKSK